MYDLDAGLQGYNLFVYCGNNPINRIDISGTDSAELDDLDAVEPELSERGGSGSGFSCGGGYANAYNPIDAGYHYSIDMSQAANSSSFSGGLYTNGYTQYQTTSDPHSNNHSGRFDPNQQAVIALAREYKNGISAREAEILVDYANEYGISNHGPATHKNRGDYWSVRLHIKIFNMHIQVYE